MPRAIWKGAISFGLVHVPVALYPASRSDGVSFDMIDKRDFAPIGYKRYNKKTGEDVSREHIVKGYEYEDGEYVVLTDEDFKQANVEATQTVDIVAFVDAKSVAPFFFDTPYYLEPGKRGEKGYALLREVLVRTGRVGIANVVLRSRQHLAAVVPFDRVLVLNTLRFAGEIRPVSEMALPDAAAVDLSDKEIAMAERLVTDMTVEWAPESHRDTYTADLMKRIEARVAAGEVHSITPAAKESGAPRGAEVIDLVSLLRRSLEKTGTGSTAESALKDTTPPAEARTAARKPAARAGAKKGSQRRRA